MTTFSLEQFYYGQVVQDGKPGDDRGLLAASPGITGEMVTQAIARLLPPAPETQIGWALIRGRSKEMPFLLVRAWHGSAGQYMAHYVVATPEFLKATGGNLMALLANFPPELPDYEQLGPPLTKMEITQAPPKSLDEQVDDILELMMALNNRAKSIEPLLAAIVQGVPLAVKSAPEAPDERVQFVEGLLALLPTSARFGVSFATYCEADTDCDAQIRFYAGDTIPDEAVVFDWAAAETTNKGKSELNDSYSRYIISQLRLDTELVIERNDAMAPIARWRLESGDRLAEALGYAAKRLKIDDALQNNQPVDKDEAGKILRDDPTLPHDLRVLYARHLIRFSLLMRDMGHAQPVALLLRKHPELEQSTLEQMREALNDDPELARLIYETLVSWMSNPLGPDGQDWVDLTHEAALTLVNSRCAAVKSGESSALLELKAAVHHMRRAHAGAALHLIVPQIIETAATIAQKDKTLSRELFLLALDHLDSKVFVNMMNTEQFRKFLDKSVTQTWAYIISPDTNEAPAGILVKTAQHFDAEDQAGVLVRFAKLASMANHFDLLDTPALKSLVRVAFDGGDHHRRLQSIARSFDDPQVFGNLDEESAAYVLQLYIMLEMPGELTRRLIQFSATRYPGDQQPEFLKLVERLFAETPLPAARSPELLENIEAAGIKLLPLTMATIGSLYKQDSTPELDALANAQVDYLLENRYLIELVPASSVLRLLAYLKQSGTLRPIALLTALAAVQQGKAGAKMLSQAYPQVEGRDQETALHMLRIYIRQIDDSLVKKAMIYFGKELGAHVYRALEITRQMRGFMGQMSLIDYAEAVQAAADLLEDSAAIYTSNTPTEDTLIGVLGSLPGNLTVQERRSLARNALLFGRAIVQFGRQYQAKRPRTEDQYVGQLLKGQTDPRSALDVFRVMSGCFSKERVTDQLTNPDTTLLSRGRTSQTLLTDLKLANGLLTHAQQTLPPEQPVKLPARGIRAEMDALRMTLPEHEQQTLTELAEDLQRLATLIAWIESEGDSKALEDSGLARRIAAGKHRPKSTLEFYRFVYTYYSRGA